MCEVNATEEVFVDQGQELYSGARATRGGRSSSETERLEIASSLCLRAMSLRSLPCRTSRLIGSAHCRQRAPRRPAAIQYRWSSSVEQSKHDETRDGPKTRSIRPFTVLALCIPLGYLVSWSVGQDDGQASPKSVDGFVRYTLVGKEPASSTSAIFTLKPAAGPGLGGLKDTDLAVKSVQIKQPQLQIARNYTLLPAQNDQDPTTIDLFIRREHRGEVSGYLHRLPLGAELELRGPVVDYALPDDLGTVVFLAGGTGIAPAMQVAHMLGSGSQMHILWANKRREDCAGGISDTPRPKTRTSQLASWFSSESGQDVSESTDMSRPNESLIVSRLHDLKHTNYHQSSPESGPLQVDYFVDEEGTFIDSGSVRKLLQSINQKSSDGRKKVLLISGPEGFISHWAGPKQWLNGRESQGPLGGLLSTLDTTGWEIVKL